AERAPLPEDQELAVQIVALRRRHLRSVLRIEAQVYPRPWTLPLFVSELALRNNRNYVAARVGGILVGYAGLLFSIDEAHVTNIAVDPEWQRHKIGSRLLLHQTRVAIKRGARHITLEVRVSNAGAQALYQRFGFVAAGIRKNYYTETNEDAVIMWAHDIDSVAYSARLAAIEAGIPGSTLDGTEQ
ncbi:MAG: ribosomal protein S18-alanine N-acetyltransferase, partial [Acidimicrobiales bacterium]